MWVDLRSPRRTRSRPRLWTWRNDLWTERLHSRRMARGRERRVASCPRAERARDLFGKISVVLGSGAVADKAHRDHDTGEAVHVHPRCRSSSPSSGVLYILHVQLAGRFLGTPQTVIRHRDTTFRDDLLLSVHRSDPI